MNLISIMFLQKLFFKAANLLCAVQSQRINNEGPNESTSGNGRHVRLDSYQQPAIFGQEQHVEKSTTVSKVSNKVKSTRTLSIPQKFRCKNFRTSELQRCTQWNVTSPSQRPDPNHRTFGCCSCEQDTKGRYSGSYNNLVKRKGHFGPTNRNERTAHSEPTSKVVRSDPKKKVRSI